MDGRERGFFVVHRRVRTSALYRSLTAEQRSVFYTLLLLANWKDRQVCVGGAWETVRRGEILQSLKTIATEAGVSVKVVRTTLAKMFADDRPVGGRGPFLTERWIGSGREVGIGSGIAAGTVPGTKAGTPVRVLTIVNYDAYQTISDDEGTGKGTGSGIAEGTQGAREGHARGTTRTKVTKVTKDLFASATPPPSPLTALTEALVADFASARGGAKYLHGGAKDAEALKRLLAAGSADEIRRRWRLAVRADGFHRCESFAQLSMPEHWNHFAAGTSAGPARLRPLGAPGTP